MKETANKGTYTKSRKAALKRYYQSPKGALATARANVAYWTRRLEQLTAAANQTTTTTNTATAEK